MRNARGCASGLTSAASSSASFRCWNLILRPRVTPLFVLLRYDEQRRRGQIWLKHQVYQRLEAASPAERKSLRFVIYVPCSEEGLDGTDQGERTRLDLLVEFRAVGVFFRIGGRRPKLFSFTQAGRRLPS